MAVSFTGLRALEERVFAFMGRFVGMVPWPYKLAQGERLELVVERSRWDSVYPAVGRSLAVSSFAAFFVTLVAATILGFQNMVRLTEDYSFFSWSTVGIWLATLVVIGLPVTTGVYVITEWERRHYRFIVFTGLVIVLRTKLALGAHDPHISRGPTHLMPESKVYSPGEKLGKSSPTFLGSNWDSWRYRIWGVRDVHFPSPLLGGADTLQGMPWGEGLATAVNEVLKRGRETRSLRDTYERMKAERVLLDAMASQSAGWVQPPADLQALVDAYNSLVPLSGEIVPDLWRVQDPGRYNLRTGEPIAAPEVKEVSLLPDLREFQF